MRAQWRPQKSGNARQRFPLGDGRLLAKGERTIRARPAFLRNPVGHAVLTGGADRSRPLLHHDLYSVDFIVADLVRARSSCRG